MKKLLCLIALLSSFAYADDPKLTTNTVVEPAPWRTTIFGGVAVVVTPGDSTVRPLGAFELDGPVSDYWRLRGLGAITTAPGQTTLNLATYHFYAVLAEGQLYTTWGNYLKVGAMGGYVSRLSSGDNVPVQSDFERYAASIGIQDKDNGNELWIHYGHDGIRGTAFRHGDIMARARVGIKGTNQDLWLAGDISVAVQSGLNANVYRIALVADVGRSIHDLSQLRKP